MVEKHGNEAGKGLGGEGSQSPKKLEGRLRRTGDPKIGKGEIEGCASSVLPQDMWPKRANQAFAGGD
ncbi:hypothetical protein E2C01_033107 [Portunus trituberculatus]|uniref:Uncharacterized protein n=1 Tax=Portunus trituberculatus TaxID=210409 RepID=A0A5B7F1J5_PORTR|nr:hypothetical protein [Portunus trituberculatus]